MKTAQTTALAALVIIGLAVIGNTVKDHPSITRHLNRFCHSLCTY